MSLALEEEIKGLCEQALQHVAEAADSDALRQVRVQYLGKKGAFTRVLRGMGDVPPEDRPRIGKLVNEARDEIEERLRAREQALSAELRAQRLQAEKIDVTLPGRRPPQGGRHPLTTVLDEIKAIFLGMGFQVVEGPEIETDYYNFEALNMPKEHPARDMQDTFYIGPELLLRTQTSPVQIRTMESRRPPVRVIAPGKVYRCDADVTHSPMFHQVEGLLVDRRVSLADLKGTLEAFCRRMFGEDRKIRFRPSYFPFTEPSAEMDVSCFACDGGGCRVCSQEGWLEILGCGMVHPRVLEMVGYDPEELSGFAFGMGVERIAMLKYRIDDIRHFFESDVRFLAQF